MPMPGYMTLSGQTQGKIDGGCTIKGHEGAILVQGVDHTIEIPKSIQTGLPTGRRIHGPLTITKEIDKSSPKRISPQGKEELYYTVEIKNAVITSMRKYVPNCLDPVNKTMGHMEEVSFTYETIIETFTPHGIEAQDSWNSPKS